MIIGVLLAGGKGSRFKAKNKNKNAVLFGDKPIIQYGVDTYRSLVNETYIVVGAYKNTVIQAVKDTSHVTFVDQRKRLGTGHAIKLVVEALKKSHINPSVVLVGYGDHMMYYTKDVLQNVVQTHVLNNNDITMITTVQKDPTSLGRIIRDKNGNVVKIVEEKDATQKERNVKEINAGFYCFSYDFLLKNYKKLTKSPVTREYYITELIQIAMNNGNKIHAYKVPFEYVGYGINTSEDLKNGTLLYNTINKPTEVMQTHELL